MPLISISQLTEITATELHGDDFLLVSVNDEKCHIQLQKMRVSEFEKYIQQKPTDKIKWRCVRCNTIVDMVKFRCKCKISPSPWEPVL